jgi:hypothetical protein
VTTVASQASYGAVTKATMAACNHHSQSGILWSGN